MAFPSGSKAGQKVITPPHSGQGEIISSPSNHGTASNAQYQTDGRKALENVLNLQEDLKGTQTVPFLTMLKALLTLKLEWESHSKADVETAFTTLLTHAVEFSNDPTKSNELKERLKEALTSFPESKRYHPLVVGLNSILSHFREKSIANLGNGRSDDEFLFVVNDPAFIQSSELTSHTSTTTKRKPDIIDPTRTALVRIFSEVVSFEEWVEEIQRNPRLKSEGSNSKRPERLNWSDLGSAWEVKVSDKTGERTNEIIADVVTKNRVFKVEDLIKDTSAAAETDATGSSREAVDPSGRALGTAADTATPPVSSGSKSQGVKRGSQDGEGDTPAPKKKRKTPSRGGSRPGSLGGSRVGSRAHSNTAAVERPPVDLVPMVQNISPEVQCASYAVELLRSSWDRTHAIVILLSDNNLSLRWHDSQGCIATTSIDILTQLPLLVAMIVLFQRFRSAMRGKAGIKLEAEIDGQPVQYTILPNAVPRWELKGRRPVTAKTTITGQPIHARQTRQNEKLNRNADLPKSPFFKFSWREDTRDSEWRIIQVARERAKHYLGENAKDVTDHLPVVKFHIEYPPLSTSHIRKHSGIETKGARIPTLVLFEELDEIDRLDHSMGGEALVEGEVEGQAEGEAEGQTEGDLEGQAEDKLERLARDGGVHGIDFATRIWEVIRCHFLLWQIGIAHGDVSFDNIMIKVANQGKSIKLYAVLNDFDLAAIMTPGRRSPSKKGFERTGTKPFMALDLLKVSDGRIQRLWRHDFESVAWSLVWYCKKEWEWAKYTHSRVAKEKRSWITECVAKRPPFDIRPASVSLWAPMALFWDDFLTAWKTTKNELEEYHTRHYLDMFDKRFPQPSDFKTREWMVFAVPRHDVRPQDVDHDDPETSPTEPTAASTMDVEKLGGGEA